jgi:hypothetical protein
VKIQEKKNNKNLKSFGTLKEEIPVKVYTFILLTFGYVLKY